MEGMRFEHFHNAATEKSAAAASDRFKRCLICPYCDLICRLLTSKTDRNPGRIYYKCTDHIASFKWADTVEPHELIEVPYCGGCSAGLCRVKKETHGPNAGRIMFLCTIKEGEGSCGYRKWQDELSEAGQSEERMNLFKTTNTVTDMVKGSQQRDERTDPVSPLFESSDDLFCPGEASQTMNQEITSRKLDQLTCLEGKSIKTSRRPHKRTRCGDTPASDFTNSASFMTVSLGLHFMSTRNCWMTDAIRQNLSTELNGWWGRLVFRPMPCLRTCAFRPSSSSVSYPLESTFIVQDISVNSSGSINPARDSKGVESYRNLSFNLEQHHNPLDSTHAVQDKILVNSSGATTSARSRLPESYSKPLVSQGQRHSVHQPLGIMSKAFHQAALDLQNELLLRLETMDVKDHEAMSQEAKTTFAVLESLKFDHEDLKKRAKELIHCASSLVEIEQSMPENDSHQRLVEFCSSERVRLDEMKCVYNNTVDAVNNHKKRLNALHEEISSTMDWLFHIEVEASCCELEMKKLELQLEKISKNKEELEGKYLIVFKELEESRKLFKQKEADHNAAKAAFNRARALLRG